MQTRARISSVRGGGGGGGGSTASGRHGEECKNYSRAEEQQVTMRVDQNSASLRKMKSSRDSTVFGQQFGNNERYGSLFSHQSWRVSRCFNLLQFGNTQQSVDIGWHLSKKIVISVVGF
jgi:hypothetical protein